MTAPLMNTYARQPIAFSHGDGVWLYDSSGKRYLDCLSGIAVNTLGHKHPKLVAALTDQINKIIHSSNLFEVPLQNELANLLLERSGMDNVFFCSTGLEANEAALKIARLYGHNKGIDLPEIVVYEKAFHGRSIATLSATGNAKVQKGFEPLVEGFVRVPLNDISALEKVAAERPNVCAVFLEAVQGEGGIQPARAEYLRATRELCNKKGWLLMIDEVQCGTGRTGKWFAHQWAGIHADVMPLAKGLSSGIPVGAVVAKGAAADVFKPGNHGTTFGGNPLAMRAGVTTIKTMEEEGLLDNAQTQGDFIMNSVRDAFKGDGRIKDIRGMGLMIGIELDRPCGEVVKKALEAGLVLNVTADSVVRLLPALIFQRQHAQELLDKLIPIIRSVIDQPLAKAA